MTSLSDNPKFVQWFHHCLDTHDYILCFDKRDYMELKHLGTWGGLEFRTIAGIERYLEKYGITPDLLDMGNALYDCIWQKSYTLQELLDALETFNFSGWDQRIIDFYIWFEYACECDEEGYRYDQQLSLYNRLLELQAKSESGNWTLQDELSLLFLRYPDYLYIKSGKHPIL